MHRTGLYLYSMITAKDASDLRQQKRQQLRRELLARREWMQRERPAAQIEINEWLGRWLEGQSFLCAGFYRPIRHEPELMPAFAAWQASAVGRQLCVPVVDDMVRRTMHYGVWNPAAVRVGAYGIEVPAQDDPTEPDVIVAPCIGVTQDGFRLGNGGGYFDRWLAHRASAGKCPVTVAVAFECLVTEAFEPEPFDMPMDWILTETGIRRVRTKNGLQPGDCSPRRR